MNVHSSFGRISPVKLTTEDFLLLRKAGAFAGYDKAELLDGELSGVPRQGEDEPKSDRSVPIKLRINHYEALLPSCSG